MLTIREAGCVWGASLASAKERHGELAMLARLCALGALLSVAAAAGPEFDLAKFKETYVRDGTVVPLPPPCCCPRSLPPPWVSPGGPPAVPMTLP